jgi:hypothetical protein
MRFILNGKAYDRTKEDVENAMAGEQPDPVRQYFVMVNGKRFPPKQVLAKALDLGRVEFTTMSASNILQRLGFKLQRY